MATFNDAVEFFYTHAGFSYDPETQTPEEGKRACAEALARAEEEGRKRGFFTVWKRDDVPFGDDVHEPDEYGYVATLWHTAAFTGERVMLASLGMIDAEDGDPYRRVVNAELAMEAISEDPGKE